MVQVKLEDDWRVIQVRETRAVLVPSFLVTCIPALGRAALSLN